MGRIVPTYRASTPVIADEFRAVEPRRRLRIGVFHCIVALALLSWMLVVAIAVGIYLLSR